MVVARANLEIGTTKKSRDDQRFDRWHMPEGRLRLIDLREQAKGDDQLFDRWHMPVGS